MYGIEMLNGSDRQSSFDPNGLYVPYRRSGMTLLGNGWKRCVGLDSDFSTPRELKVFCFKSKTSPRNHPGSKGLEHARTQSTTIHHLKQM